MSLLQAYVPVASIEIVLTLIDTAQTAFPCSHGGPGAYTEAVKVLVPLGDVMQYILPICLTC